MANLNKTFQIGRLTRDPEVRYSPSGTAVCKFGLANDHKYKDKCDTLFVDCVAFGKTGEVIAQYLTKGRLVHVEGRLKLNQWETERGEKRSKIEIVVESFQFLDSASNKAGDGGGERRTRLEDIPF